MEHPQREITIQTGLGTRPVVASTFGEYIGLHKAVSTLSTEDELVLTPDMYTVTHIPSGFAFPPSMLKLEEAEAMAQQLALLPVDWATYHKRQSPADKRIIRPVLLQFGVDIRRAPISPHLRQTVN